MKTYLMTISIGPVQDFIAAARRLRDLWFGSYLLSELAKQASRTLRDNKAALIFPAPAAPDKDLAPDSAMRAPNKILARVDASDPRQLFNEMKASLERFWIEELAQKTIKNARSDVDQTLFDRQIGDFLEIYGAWTPENGDYPAARERVDGLLAARKSLRDFQQTRPLETDQGGGLPKSSLDGLRESVLKGERRRKGIKKNEELDALGWIKRYGEKDGHEKLPDFESLSDLAADPFLRGIVQNPKAAAAVGALADAFKSLELDLPRVAPKDHRKPLKGLPPQSLFFSRIARELEEKGVEPKRRREVFQLIRRVCAAAGHKQGPLPYAAILVGDGDRMGKTIERIRQAKEHQRFSVALDGFARSCQAIAANHRGSLVYSGGDDVVAFAPLDMALSCVRAFQSEFDQRMSAIFPEQSERPTFSIGMAIVHHLRPMGLSFQLARKAERLAKDSGRNALAVILDKRGGAPIEIVGQWPSGIAERLTRWADCHLDDLIPDKLGYELRMLAREFGDDRLEWDPDNALVFEFLRVLKRKRSDGGRLEIGDEQMAAVRRTAAALGRLSHLSDELIVSRIFADAKRQAGKEAT